ncbi:SUMO ligase siz1 [Linnemannia hyalina]|uniref:SUMO ligase siz1 n=1 Tax=Linnemannia hyalina TaxID=64524 RepID=A0A9P7Y2I9_9FUNG|nr:SUMO ligase siz1 [Linnemannia hyalina]
MEDMLRQVRQDYHPNTEFYLWEIVADFHREYRDPGMMSKWQYINAFVPRIHPSVENVTSNVFQNTFIIADPGYSPPLRPHSAPIVDPGPDVTISTNPTIPGSRPQSQNATINRLSASSNTDDALAWKLSASAKARLLYKSSPFYQNLMALTVPQYGRSSRNESVLTFKLRISSSLSQQLMSNPQYSIMVFCASKETPTSQQMLMEFPDDCYIRVNNQTLDWRPRGVKNKPGTFTPVDITRFCLLQESSVNHVELRYSNASKKKINDDDIMELSSTLSLKCPSLKNVNVHPDGRWEIPAAIISIDIDDSTSIPTDSGSSSSEPTSHGTDNGPIYVIDDDDDDDEDNRNGSDSSYDMALADLSMEAKEDEVNGAGSRSNYGPSGRQESQPVKNYPLITISPKPASTLLHLYVSSRSQRVPEKPQFMDLTLYSSDDVIDLTSDNEDEDQDQDEDDEENEEELTLHRRKRAFIQPDNDPSNEINDITLTTNDITLTNKSNSGNTGSDSVKCRRVSNKHDNYKRTANSLSAASNNPEPSDTIMEDLTQPRSFGPAEATSTSAMLPKDPRQAEQGHAHPYHTSNLQSTLPPTTHSTAPVTSFTPSERLSSPTNGDLTLLPFESVPFMISSLDSIIEGISGHPGVPENAIPSWPAYDPTFVSSYIPYSLGIFGQTSDIIGADGYQDQAGLPSNCEQGERFEVDGGVGNGDGEGSEERPNKRPYTASGVPSSSSHFSPELEHETEVHLKSVLKQYMATPDIFL